MPCASSSTNRAGRSWACPGHPGSPWRGSLGQARPRRSFKLVADRDAGDVGGFQRPAYRFGLIAVEAGRTPSRPFPVPWFAGWGGRSVLAMSGLLASALLVSALLVSALATTALEVSGTSGCAAGIALVIGGAGCAAPAEASFTCPALIWTVLTLTGFIGSAEPGMAAIAWVWVTPEVSGAGSGLGVGGTAREGPRKIGE